MTAVSTSPTTPSPARVIEKFSPVSGEKLQEFPISSAEDVEAAVARARAAFVGWRDLGLTRRLEILDRVREVLLKKGEEYAREISRDTGKPYQDSLSTEILAVALLLEYNRKKAPKILARRRAKTPIVFAGKSSLIEYFPRGVVGVISPWNFPFQLGVAPVISALVGGNTVVLKPSEVTPITGEVVRDLFAQAGLPEGVVEVIQGDGSTGAALCQADVDMLFFTGSVATGRKVMAAAAKRPIPVELELGGKDAMIVCADANIKRAAKAAAWGAFANCGQVCVSVERLFVVESIHDKFVELVREEVENIRVGGPDDDADVGPMIFAPQLKTVTRHIADAIERGAKVLTGGEQLRRDGQFFAPTMLTDITPEMEIYREETFGPVLPIIKVRDEEEALRLANDHKYGLNASVWTQNIKKGISLASRLECGQATVNDVINSVGNPSLPFGGVKSSGIGRYHGPDGLRAFMHTKAIMVDRGILNNEPLWFPYAGKYPAVAQLFRGLLGRKVPQMAGGMIKLLRGGKSKKKR